MHIYVLFSLKILKSSLPKRERINLVNILHRNCNIEALAALYDKEINV